MFKTQLIVKEFIFLFKKQCSSAISIKMTVSDSNKVSNYSEIFLIIV